MYRLSRALRGALVLLSVLIAALGVVTLVYAAEYSINTNDGGISEWSAQGISVFQTDPDESGISDQSLDIKSVWVARSPSNANSSVPTLNFLMEVYGPNAITTVNHAAAAIIDCDRDMAANDDHDRLVVYIRDGSGGIPDDALYIANGDYSPFYTPGASEAENHALGQPVGSFVEWAAALEDLPTSESDPTNYCQGQVNIRFATALIEVVSYFPTEINITFIDETTPFIGWDVPTSVEMSDFRASSQPTFAQALLFASGGLAMVAGVWLFRLVRKDKRLNMS